VDVAELRADFLDTEELGGIVGFARSRPEPLVLTLRRSADGGRWVSGEQDRAALLARALEAGGYSYVELEEDFDPPSVREALRLHGARVIRSRHDASGVPADPGRVVQGLPRGEDEIPKLAVMPRGCADLGRILAAASRLKSTGGQWILVGMGEYGLATRVLATPLGVWLTYCSEAAGPAAAPGQPSVEDMVDLYRYPRITEATRRYAVIGNPIAHTRSPHIHNAGLAALGLDAVYLPFRVDDPGAFLVVAEQLAIQGVSVTVPHKTAVLRYLSRTDDTVLGAGSCNTLVREGKGWFGVNTDIEGFLRPLRTAGLVPGPGTRATVIGAGGSGRAVTYALRTTGAAVLVLNRDSARAAALASQHGCASGGLGQEGARLAEGYADLIVQTTSFGMEPQAHGDPLPEYTFRGSEYVYELVYRPPVTCLLRRAQEAGCRCIGGMEMLREQACLQFRLYTGQDYPRELAPWGGSSQSAP
jgi:3-dehydroquinate dehydratase/shikimate dehydrogenase